MEDYYTRILTKFRDRAMEIIKSIDYSIEKDAPGIMIAAGNGNPDYVRQMLESISPQTILLYYTDEDSHADSLSNLFTSGNVLFSSLSEETYYSDKAGILTALCPNRKIIFSIPLELEKQISEKLKKIQEALNDALVNANQSNLARLLYLRNSLFNMKRILSSPKVEINFDSSAPPVIICGAGPSLKNQLETLKKYQSKFLIFCVGRVLGILLDAGIKPDIVFQTDPDVSLNFAWSGNISKKNYPLLAASINISPHFASFFEKIIWFYGDSFAANRFLIDNNCELSNIEISRTVMVSAIDMALKLGCTNIALLGSDLCLSESKKHHADEKTDIEMSYAGLLEIQGNNGEKAITIPELETLRKAIEKYLATRKIAVINNCSEKGAYISGAPYMDLEEFCKKFPGRNKKFIVAEETRKATEKNIVKKIAYRLKEYSSCLTRIVNSAELLLCELSKRTPNFDMASKFQNALIQTQQIEFELRKNPMISFILSPIEEQISEILSEMPDANLNDQSPQIRLAIMLKRYSFANDFCIDIINDLAMDKPIDKMKFREFKSFKNHAISFIAKNNMEYAEFLREQKSCAYSFVFQLQYLPYSIKNPDGSVFFQKDSHSFEIETKECAENFLKKNSFDPSSMAVIFLAPGNWAHIVRLAKACPEADIIVLDPWLEMFVGIIRSAMFMQYLPEKTLVIGVDNRLPNWRALFAAKINEWQSSGKKILLYETPETQSKPELASLKEEIKNLL